MPQKHSAIFDGLLKMKESMMTYICSEFPKKEKTEKNQNPGDTDNVFVLLFAVSDS